MSTHSVLVVDGDGALRDLLASHLPCPDIRVEHERSRTDGRRRVEECPFELIAIDMNSGGFELLREVRRLRPEARVILVGEPAPGRIVEALRAGAYSFFSQPVSSYALADMTRQACELSSWEDDVELLSGSEQWISLRVRCRLSVADRVAHIFREMLSGAPNPASEDAVTAARELLMNAIEHGGRSDPALHIEIAMTRGRQNIVGYVRDPGNGFSFQGLEHAAVANPEGLPTHHVDLRQEHGQRPGGFGILMARSLVDDLVYNERGNEVLFVKHFRD